MTCTEFLAILDDVIDESIAVETRAEIEVHLRKCGHCEVVLDTTRKTIDLPLPRNLRASHRSQRAAACRHHGEVQKGLAAASNVVVTEARTP